MFSGFNQRKSPSRTIAIVVDISKTFNTVSHHLLIKMIYRSRLCHNLVRWLVAYLHGRKASCLYQQHLSSSHQVRAGVPQGSIISPALFNHFVSYCTIPDLDMTSYADDFTLLASAPSIVEAEARANQLCAILVRWANGKQLDITLPKSCVTLFKSDTHQSRLLPQVRIGDAVAPLNRTPKILGVTLNTHLTFGPHARDCVEQASRALNVMKTLAGSSWGFTTETLVATYKAIVRPILNYAEPNWFTQVSSSHLDKLEVIHNKALRVATGCHQKAAASHLRAETGPPPEGALRTLLPSVLCLRPPTPSPQSPPLPPPAPSGLPSRPHTTTHSEACESEVTTPTPPSSSGVCWKRAFTLWQDASSRAG